MTLDEIKNLLTTGEQKAGYRLFVVSIHPRTFRDVFGIASRLYAERLIDRTIEIRGDIPLNQIVLSKDSLGAT